MDNNYSVKRNFPWENFEQMADDASIIFEAMSSGILDVACVQEKIEMKKRMEILKAHKYEIYEGKDGNWYTYLPDEQKGRIKKKRKTREALEEDVIKFYRNGDKKQQQQEYRFCNWWNIWKEKKVSYGVCSNTIKRYESDYKRFFAGTDFERKDIRYVTEEDITSFMVECIKSMELKDRAGKTLWGYIVGVFETARTRKKITEDPCLSVDTKLFNKLYNREQKPLEQRVLSSGEMKLLMQQIHKDQEKKPLYIQPYAIELAVYTGMRVGELAALRWENVLLEDEIIIISESEKHDRATNEYYISGTKTGKIRHYPMTKEMKAFFKNLMKLQMKNGWLGEFVFSNANGRVTARSISECLRRKCKQAGIRERGIHALRRTLNSQLRCEGVSATVAAALLGHTEEVNQMNYTYDISDMDYKREVVKRAIS